MLQMSRTTVVAFVIALAALAGVVNGAPGNISLISVRWPGQSTSMYQSYSSRISADGRFLAFLSISPDLVPRTTALTVELYVRNLRTGTIERISADSSGHAANADSDAADMSADGRYVAYSTSASNLVPGDTNSVGDVFVRDRQTSSTERVSVNSSGVQGHRASYAPSISADGRYVAFASKAANLVPGDSNKTDDVFVHDRLTGATERISVNSNGGQANSASFAPAISGDGRFVAFISRATNLVTGDTNASDDVFVRDRVTGQTERLSLGAGGGPANGASSEPAISADGRYVAFLSDASNLVAGDTNAATDLFVRDRQTGRTERDSVNSSGAQTTGILAGYPDARPDISGNGRFVAFTSSAGNLPAGGVNYEIYVHDRLTGQTMLASASSAGVPADNFSLGSSLSTDGRFLAFSSYSSILVKGDRNGTLDAFVRDRQSSTLILASTNEVTSRAAGGFDSICDGNAAIYGPAINADGRYVAFLSTAPDLVPNEPAPTGSNVTAHVFVRDRQASKTSELAPDLDAMNVAISADGNTVAGSGWCSGTAFIADRQTGKRQLLPLGVTVRRLSNNGRFAAFDTSESDLVPGDTNSNGDAFVFDRRTSSYERVSVSSRGQQANSYSWSPTVSGNGRFVVFTSDASNLVPGDTNGAWDTFVHDRSTGKTERVSVNSAGQQATGGSAAGSFYSPDISADGRFAAYESSAVNLVPHDLNNAWDVFVRDRQTAKTERVSVSSSGVAGNGDSFLVALSADGRFVVFWSNSTNLVPNSPYVFYYLRDRQAETTEALLAKDGGNFASTYAYPAMSAGARFMAFSSYDPLVKTDLNTAASHDGAVDTYLLERAAPSVAVISSR